MADEATNPTPTDETNAPVGADSVSDQQAPVDTPPADVPPADEPADEPAAPAPAQKASVKKGSAPAEPSKVLAEDQQTSDELLHNARNDAQVNHAANLAEQPKAA